MNEGYVYIGFGRKFINEVCLSVASLRRHGDFRPVDVVTSTKDEEYAKKRNVFNNIIVHDIDNDELVLEAKTDFEKFGMIPKLRICSYANYQYTMYLDTDILCVHNTEKAWDFLKKQNQALTITGSTNNPHWHWEFWHQVCKQNNIPCLEASTGVMFINKNYSSDFSKLFDLFVYGYRNYDSLGMKRFFRGGRVEEPVMAWGIAKAGLTTINFRDFPIMTCCLKPTDDIPTKIQNCRHQEGVMDDYIPFSHQFEKSESPDYHLLYFKVMHSYRERDPLFS